MSVTAGSSGCWVSWACSAPHRGELALVAAGTTVLPPAESGWCCCSPHLLSSQHTRAPDSMSLAVAMLVSFVYRIQVTQSHFSHCVLGLLLPSNAISTVSGIPPAPKYQSHCSRDPSCPPRQYWKGRGSFCPKCVSHLCTLMPAAQGKQKLLIVFFAWLLSTSSPC